MWYFHMIIFSARIRDWSSEDHLLDLLQMLVSGFFSIILLAMLPCFSLSQVLPLETDRLPNPHPQNSSPDYNSFHPNFGIGRSLCCSHLLCILAYSCQSTHSVHLIEWNSVEKRRTWEPIIKRSLKGKRNRDSEK